MRRGDGAWRKGAGLGGMSRGFLDEDDDSEGEEESLALVDEAEKMEDWMGEQMHSGQLTNEQLNRLMH